MQCIRTRSVHSVILISAIDWNCRKLLDSGFWMMYSKYLLLHPTMVNESKTLALMFHGWFSWMNHSHKSCEFSWTKVYIYLEEISFGFWIYLHHCPHLYWCSFHNLHPWGQAQFSDITSILGNVEHDSVTLKCNHLNLWCYETLVPIPSLMYVTHYVIYMYWSHKASQKRYCSGVAWRYFSSPSEYIVEWLHLHNPVA